MKKNALSTRSNIQEFQFTSIFDNDEGFPKSMEKEVRDFYQDGQKGDLLY